MKINSINPNITSYNSVVSKWKRIRDDSVHSANSFFDEAKELLDSVKKRIGYDSVRTTDVSIFPESEVYNHLYNYENQSEVKFKISLKEVIEKYTRWQKIDKNQKGKFIDFLY